MHLGGKCSLLARPDVRIAESANLSTSACRYTKSFDREPIFVDLEVEMNKLFPECVARVPVSFGGLGVKLCSRKVVSVSATVRNRLRDRRNRLRDRRNRLRVRRKALHSGECVRSGLESV